MLISSKCSESHYGEWSLEWQWHSLSSLVGKLILISRIVLAPFAIFDKELPHILRCFYVFLLWHWSFFCVLVLVLVLELRSAHLPQCLHI